jgi:hypothetical protein
MKYFRLLFGCFYKDTKGHKKIIILVNQGEILIVHVHHAALLVYQLAVCVCPLSLLLGRFILCPHICVYITLISAVIFYYSCEIFYCKNGMFSFKTGWRNVPRDVNDFWKWNTDNEVNLS